ncbi:MAG: PqqD family protein [Desulfobacteraceae bacterium]
MPSAEIDINGIYVQSEDVVAREIEDEFILVPIASGIGDLEDAIYTLNETGKEIWKRLDHGKTVKSLVDELLTEFDAAYETIINDVCGILGELVSLNMVELVE